MAEQVGLLSAACGLELRLRSSGHAQGTTAETSFRFGFRTCAGGPAAKCDMPSKKTDPKEKQITTTAPIGMMRSNPSNG